MNPTPSQLARAAELGPDISAACGDLAFWWDRKKGELEGSLWIGKEKTHPASSWLDPRAFQAIVLALPPCMADRLLHEVSKGFAWESWLLTPAGMLAFYEAVVQQDHGKE